MPEKTFLLNESEGEIRLSWMRDCLDVTELADEDEMEPRGRWLYMRSIYDITYWFCLEWNKAHRDEDGYRYDFPAFQTLFRQVLSRVGDFGYKTAAIRDEEITIAQLMKYVGGYDIGEYNKKVTYTQEMEAALREMDFSQAKGPAESVFKAVLRKNALLLLAKNRRAVYSYVCYLLCCAVSYAEETAELFRHLYRHLVRGEDPKWLVNYVKKGAGAPSGFRFSGNTNDVSVAKRFCELFDSRVYMQGITGKDPDRHALMKITADALEDSAPFLKFPAVMKEIMEAAGKDNADTEILEQRILELDRTVFDDMPIDLVKIFEYLFIYHGAYLPFDRSTGITYDEFFDLEYIGEYGKIFEKKLAQYMEEGGPSDEADREASIKAYAAVYAAKMSALEVRIKQYIYGVRSILGPEMLAFMCSAKALTDRHEDILSGITIPTEIKRGGAKKTEYARLYPQSRKITEERAAAVLKRIGYRSDILSFVERDEEVLKCLDLINGNGTFADYADDRIAVAIDLESDTYLAEIAGQM